MHPYATYSALIYTLSFTIKRTMNLSLSSTLIDLAAVNLHVNTTIPISWIYTQRKKTLYCCWSQLGTDKEFVYGSIPWRYSDVIKTHELSVVLKMSLSHLKHVRFVFQSYFVQAECTHVTGMVSCIPCFLNCFKRQTSVWVSDRKWQFKCTLFHLGAVPFRVDVTRILTEVCQTRSINKVGVMHPAMSLFVIINNE